ncbi:hypothetical protein B0O80DRAFT_179915 [Mortierella sp. GBAus27b]|nr:hypothetical protein B0O80DRAFT_179915 [Mortierella sp. GBAus27b]
MSACRELIRAILQQQNAWKDQAAIQPRSSSCPGPGPVVRGSFYSPDRVLELVSHIHHSRTASSTMGMLTSEDHVARLSANCTGGRAQTGTDQLRMEATGQTRANGAWTIAQEQQGGRVLEFHPLSSWRHPRPSIRITLVQTRLGVHLVIPLALKTVSFCDWLCGIHPDT